MGGGALDQQLFNKSDNKPIEKKAQIEEKQHKTEFKPADTPLPSGKKLKKKSAKDGKHQLSGWIQMNYFLNFAKLYRSVNPIGIETVEKQFMLGEAINLLNTVMGEDVPVFKSEEDFKKYLDSRIKDKF